MNHVVADTAQPFIVFLRCTKCHVIWPESSEEMRARFCAWCGKKIDDA